MHLKKNQLFSLFILIALCFSSCKSDSNSEKIQKKPEKVFETNLGTFKKYTHKKGKYSLLVPENWKVDKKKKEGCGFISAKENPSDSFKEFLDIYVKAGGFVKNQEGEMVAENLTSEEWLLKHFEVLMYSNPSFDINDRGNIEIGASKVPFITFLKEKDDITYETAIYLLAKDNRAYIITTILDLTKKTFYEPRFKEMIKSLRL